MLISLKSSQRHWAKEENLLEQGLPLRDPSGYTDTPITREQKSLGHKTEKAILVYPTPSQ